MRRSPSSGHVTTAAGASSQHVRPGVQEFNRIQVAQSTLSHRSGTYHESATEVTGTFPPPPQCLDPVSSHALGAEYTEHKICPSDYLQASRSRSSAQVAPPSPPSAGLHYLAELRRCWAMERQLPAPGGGRRGGHSSALCLCLIGGELGNVCLSVIGLWHWARCPQGFIHVVVWGRISFPYKAE